MIRGYCSKCRKALGGFAKPSAWQCHKCLNLYCEQCCPKRAGIIFKKPICPECSIELFEGGVRYSRS